MSLLIFDCDGVLIDSERLYNRSWAEILPTLGLDWAPADCARNLMGRPLPDCEAIVSAALGRALPDDFLERVFAATDRLFASEGLHPVPGIAEALAVLPQRKCVASSGLLGHVRGNLARTGLLAHFGEDLFVAAMVPRGKPAPDLFLYAAERMGATPADCVVIEDSLPGVQGARAAGMRVLGYAGGEHDAGALAAAGAELFDSMHHLPALITGQLMV